MQSATEGAGLTSFLRPFCLLLIVSVIFGCGRAELQGKVVDRFGNGIEGVTVSIDNRQDDTITDADGNYVLPYTPGTFSVLFGKQGYAPETVQLVVDQSKTVTMKKVTLKPDTAISLLSAEGLLESGNSDVPQWVLDQKVKLVSSDQPYEVKEFRQGDIMDVDIDKATGYRVIDGKKWAGIQVCVSCGKQIPVKPREIKDEPSEGPEMEPPPIEEFESYTCPLCGKEANPRPGRSTPSSE